MSFPARTTDDATVLSTAQHPLPRMQGGTGETTLCPIPCPSAAHPTAPEPLQASSQSAIPLPVGYTFPAPYHQYAITKCLGCGAFGITYLVEDTRLDRRVVVKECLPKSYARRREDGCSVEPLDGQAALFSYLRESFLTEARALAETELKHPNIVSIIDFIEDVNGTDYYIMEYVQGYPVTSAAPEELPQLAVALLQTLSHLHSHRRLHVDLKPDNILLKKDGSPVLIDFGSSVRIGADAVAYTPDYAAPELKETNKPDIRTDLYALGLTLARLSGSGDCPRDLGIERAIRPDASLRWSSAEEWLAALKNVSLGDTCRLIIPGKAEALPADRRHLLQQVQAGATVLHLAATAEWTAENTALCRDILTSAAISESELSLLVYRVADLSRRQVEYVSEMAQHLNALQQEGRLPRLLTGSLSLTTARQVIPAQTMFDTLLQEMEQGDSTPLMPPVSSFLRCAEKTAEQILRPIREHAEQKLKTAIAPCPGPQEIERQWLNFSFPEKPPISADTAGEMKAAAALSAWLPTARPNKNELGLCLSRLCDTLTKAIEQPTQSSLSNHLCDRNREWEKRGLLARLFRVKEKRLLNSQREEVCRLLREKLDEMQAECYRTLLGLMRDVLSTEQRKNQDILDELKRQQEDKLTLPSVPWRICTEAPAEATTTWFPEAMQADDNSFNILSARLREARVRLSALQQTAQPMQRVPFAAMKNALTLRQTEQGGRVYILAPALLLPELRLLVSGRWPSAALQEQPSLSDDAVVLHLLPQGTPPSDHYLPVFTPLTAPRP